MTPPEEYVKALDKAIVDLEDRLRRRDLLNAEIAGLKETVRVLSGLIGTVPEKQKRVAQLLAAVDAATPNLTHAIRYLLTIFHPQEMSATEVRNAIEDSGFDFGDFSNPLSACHSALKRLLADGDIENGKPKDGKITYRGILKGATVFGTGFWETLLATPSSPPNTHPVNQIKRRPTLGQHIAGLPTVPPPPTGDEIEDSLKDTFKPRLGPSDPLNRSGKK